MRKLLALAIISIALSGCTYSNVYVGENAQDSEFKDIKTTITMPKTVDVTTDATIPAEVLK